mgnify:FL=1
MQIATNTTSRNISNEMRENQLHLSDRLTNLTTGKRINSSSDDSANLQISNRLGKHNTGMSVAIRNANDGISVVQTAEGAAQETTNMLQRMRELAIQSANASNTGRDREALQEEVIQLKQELDRIADTTTFGGQLLLNGSFGSQQFQVGSDANEVITLSLTSLHTSDLTHNEFELNGQATDNIYLDSSLVGAKAKLTSEGFGNNAAGPQTEVLTLQGKSSQSVALNSDDSAKAIATKINAEFDKTNVSANAKTEVALHFHDGVTTNRTAFEADELVSFDIGNGSQTRTVSITASGSMNEDMVALRNKINEEAALTGVGAEFDSVSNQLILTNNFGDNIEISNYFESSEGVDNQVALTTIDLNGAFSQSVNMSNDGAAAVIRGHGELESVSNFKVKSNIDFGTVNNAIASNTLTHQSVEESIENIDLTTIQGAQDAISAIDSALSAVDKIRSNLGGLQNRFSSTINNLSTNHENSNAARGRLVNADYSKEAAELARLKVTQQATTALLGQANSMQDQAIRLLG